jgi:hypothetical protein
MKPSKRRRGLAIAGGTTALEALFLRRRSGKLLGLRTIVRCRRGHLFTTTWIPGASVKALRLGPWRVQRCPVGKHWSIVRPVGPEELSDAERAGARSVRDTLLP